jgi:hypothetical protein
VGNPIIKNRGVKLGQELLEARLGADFSLYKMHC